MNLETAIKTMEKVNGVDDKSTAVGEAWATIKANIDLYGDIDRFMWLTTRGFAFRDCYKPGDWEPGEWLYGNFSTGDGYGTLPYVRDIIDKEMEKE